MIAKQILIMVSCLVIGASAASAQTGMVMIPLGTGNTINAGDCPPAAGTSIGGPAALYNFCWYVGDDDESCDDVCRDLDGANLAYLANDEWEDNCSAPGDDDVVKWFLNNGNPAGWNGTTGATSYRSLGYGLPNGPIYGKCTIASAGAGAYPGDNGSFTTNNVCPCFGFAVPE